MLLKIVIVLLLFIVFYCLTSGLYFLVGHHEKPDRMVKALTWRIGLSLVVFLLLILAYWMGWITPHGLAQGGK